MKYRKRWWWWVALSGAVVVAGAIPGSFRWVMEWTDSRSRYYLYIDHGVLHGNNVQIPGMRWPRRPWCGSLRFRRSWIYDPWVLLPSFWDHGNGEWDFKLPLHFPFFALVAIVVVPILPPVIKRKRRKRGLCVKCEYDLRGNVSGVCPECGTKIEAPRTSGGAKGT